MSDELTLQEAVKKGRKRGWFQCENCGMEISLNYKDDVEEHIEGEGCNKAKEILGDLIK